MQHILVATDGSTGADRAVDVAGELAKAVGGKLSIVTIWGTLSAEEMKQLARAEGNIGDALEALSAQILMAAKDRARRLGASDVEVQTGWGDTAEQIIALAKHKNADTIVLGRRGRGRLAGLLLGSVSQKVASLAPCNVVVVP
jgi:nucleotide-binding universal stress UspA family protein